MGAESGSQRILDAMDKGTRVEQIHDGRENLRRHGIRACFFLQFGYPGEDWSEIEATIRMVRDTAPDDIGISVSYPLPGTKFHQNVSRADLSAKANWSDSADLAMMFRGAIRPIFIALWPTLSHRRFAAADDPPGWRVASIEPALARACGGGGLMRLLLTHGYFLAEDAKEQQIMKPYAPLGLLYLSSHLRAKGFDVEIYDSTFGSREELFRILGTASLEYWAFTAI